MAMGARLRLLLSLWAAAHPAAQSDPLPTTPPSADQVLAEACRAEFSYLRRVCHEFDVDGPSTQMTGLQSDVPQTQWPFMQFCYFGFACANLATYDSTVRTSALEEMPWLIENLQKVRLTGFISEHFGPPFGPGFVQPSVFVHGLFLNLAVRYREVSGDTRFDPLMRQVASTLSEAFGNSSEGILPTYRDMWWLGDNLPALSALVRYDRLFGTDLSAVKRRYVQSVKEAYLDERGLFSSYAGWALLSSLGLCSGAEFRRDGAELALSVMPPVGQAVILFGKTELLKRRHIAGALLLE